MGRSRTSSREGESISHTRAPTKSISTQEDYGYKGSHIATLGSNFTSRAISGGERNYVLNSSNLHYISNNSSRKEVYDYEHHEHLRKQSFISTSCHRFPPGSPSESNSSSKLSNLGSSTSSSPSSASSFNESASSLVGDVSSLSARCKEKQTKRIPDSSRFHSGYSWNDTEIRRDDALKRVKAYFLEAERSEDGPHKNALRCEVSRQYRWSQGLTSSRFSDFDKELTDTRIRQRRRSGQSFNTVMPFAEVHPENVFDLSCTHKRLPRHTIINDLFESRQRNGSFRNLLFPGGGDATICNHKSESTFTQSNDSSVSTFRGSNHGNCFMKGDSFKHKQDSSSNIHCRDLECKLFNGGIKYGHSFGSYRRVGFVSEGVRAQNQFQFPVFDVSSCSKLYASEVSDHGSSLYENEVRIDKQTLKVKATSYYPAKIAKPLKSNGLHKSADEDPKAFVPAISTSRKSQAHGKYYIHKECPIAKEKKPTFSSILYSHNEDYSRRDMSIRHKESQCSSILHSSYGTGIESAVPVFKAKVHEQTLRQSTASQNDRKYTEKADAFAPHAPLQPAQFKHEGSKPDPSIPLGSKGQKDWRSKSMGAKATIKSAVKNLEATLSGHRSLSLPKTRPQPIKQSKHESSKLLDRVFISPIRARSKQVSTMKTAERLDKHIEESKDGKVAERKEAKATNSKLLPHSVGPTVRPFSPIGQSNREISCKPFTASKINTYLSAEIGVHRAVNTFNSDWNEDACSADASYKCGMLDAHLRYTEKDGQLYYTMAIIGSEDLMLAKPCWVESHSNGGTSMCQYLFYSGQVRSRGGANGWRSWIRKENKPSLDICGIMKVSNINENAVHLARNTLEFVLYDGRSAVEVPHSQSLRFCSADKPNTLSRDYSVASSISSSTLQMSSACSVSSSPIHLDVTANKHCKVSRTDLFPVDKEASMRNDSIQRSTPGHKPSLSFDSWSELDLLESAPLPVFMPCSSSEFELAAIIIQVSAEGNNCGIHDRHINQKGLDSGVKHLIDEFSHIATPRMESSSLDQANSNPKEAPVDEKLNLSGRYDHKQIQNENQTPNQVKMMQHYQNSSLRENMISQESPARITLLLPMGAHSSPLSDSRGPSSLLDRYRSGGACDCGGWDLGCGIDVISSEDTIENGSPYKQRDGVIHNEEKINLFSQGIRQRLMLCLSPVKHGEFSLRFQKQLSPLKVLATAVAMFHTNQSLFLKTSQSS